MREDIKMFPNYIDSRQRKSIEIMCVDWVKGKLENEESPSGNSKYGVTDGADNSGRAGKPMGPEGLSEGSTLSDTAEPMLLHRKGDVTHVSTADPSANHVTNARSAVASPFPTDSVAEVSQEVNKNPPAESGSAEKPGRGRRPRGQNTAHITLFHSNKQDAAVIIDRSTVIIAAAVRPVQSHDGGDGTINLLSGLFLYTPVISRSQSNLK